MHLTKMYKAYDFVKTIHAVAMHNFCEQTFFYPNLFFCKISIN